ncbi:PD40 domain-containing protein, partial [bacterium]|nr:PD40 domain-containing protein [bacterium]
MLKRKLLLLAASILLIFNFQALAQKRAFTIEDLYKIKSVGDAQVSPDSRKLLFTVAKYNLKKGQSNSDIFLMDLTNNEIVQMTRNKAADFHPRWSPDGKSFMFLSSRGKGLQIWLMPVNGGEPEKITDFPIGISDPIWADNNHIVFSADVFPEYGADFEKNKKESDSMGSGPLQAHMADKLLYRHWTAWADGKRTHTFILDVKSGDIKDLTPGDYNAPRFSLGGSGYAVSSDGKELCVVSNHDPDPWSSTNGDLWVCSSEHGYIKNISEQNRAFDGSPVYSPDGKYIAFLKQTIPGYESDKIRLAVYNRNTGKIRTLTESVDSWINEFVWSPDSKSIYFTANQKGDVPLFKVDLKSGRIKKLLTDRTLRGIAVSPDGKYIV